MTTIDAGLKAGESDALGRLAWECDGHEDSHMPATVCFVPGLGRLVPAPPRKRGTDVDDGDAAPCKRPRLRSCGEVKKVTFAEDVCEVQAFREAREECRRVFRGFMDKPLREKMKADDVRVATQGMRDQGLLLLYVDRVLSATSTTAEITWRSLDDDRLGPATCLPTSPRPVAATHAPPVLSVRYCPIVKERANLIKHVVSGAVEGPAV